MNLTNRAYTYEDFIPVIDMLATGNFPENSLHMQEAFEQIWDEVEDGKTICKTARCLSGWAQFMYEPDTHILGAVDLKDGPKNNAIDKLFYHTDFTTEQVVEYFNNINDDGSVNINNWVIDDKIILGHFYHNITFTNCTIDFSKIPFHDYVAFDTCTFNNCTFKTFKSDNDIGKQNDTFVFNNCTFNNE